MKPAISVHNLSKQYRIGKKPSRDNNLTENIRRQFSTAWDKVSRLVTPNKEFEKDESFWALKDVSFEVQPGEVVGIIGRNGAGKSTLLKILSQIVEPTSGHADIHGRMGSLLEVGTGFHPELTGRENIYLNGAILGMKREEITKKFDEIVAFAEVEKFLDTPVKRYSSGMYVRLAFAVAAHLELEILVVDEVLAVGDATFQRRCLDRMVELARSGRTILFVSHNMQVVPVLCQAAILLNHGRVARVGPSSAVTREHLSGLVDEAKEGNLQDKPRNGNGKARFVRAWVAAPSGAPISQHISGDDLTVRMEIESSIPLPAAAVAVVLATRHGTRVVTGWTTEAGFSAHLAVGRQLLECRFRNVAFRPGHSFLVHLWMADHDLIDWVENAAVVEVGRGAGQEHLSPDDNQGAVVFHYDWRAIPVD